MSRTNETRLRGTAGLEGFVCLAANGPEDNRIDRPAQAENRLREIAITLGRNKIDTNWTHQKRMSFDELAVWLAVSPRGPKDGPCFTPATFSGGRRNLNEAVEIGIAVLDSDCGHAIDEIRASIKHAGFEAIVHSTHSHLTCETQVAASALANGNVAAFLREKRSLLPRVAEGAEVTGKSPDGANLIIRHKPYPKFRIIIPLAEPWQAADFETQAEANSFWREFVTSLSSMLGLQTDQACSDTSRLFYLPRVRSEDAEYQFDHIAGNPCDMRKVVEEAMAHASRDGLFQSNDGETPAWLRKWAATHAQRFEIVAALQARSPDRLGRLNGAKQITECPFEADHTRRGGEGTIAINASQVPAAGLTQIDSGFLLKCSHNACAKRDRLALLAGMLDCGWLARDDLIDAAFLGSAKPYEPDAFKPNGGASGASADDAEIARLAALRPADYDRARKDAAVKLGIRVLLLDKLVEAARPKDGLVAGKGAPWGFQSRSHGPSPSMGRRCFRRLPRLSRTMLCFRKRYRRNLCWN